MLSTVAFFNDVADIARCETEYAKKLQEEAMGELEGLAPAEDTTWKGGRTGIENGYNIGHKVGKKVEQKGGHKGGGS